MGSSNAGSRSLRIKRPTNGNLFAGGRLAGPSGRSALAAGALLGYFLEEIGPLIYNQAIGQAQERLQARVSELDLELHEDAFQYWSRRGQGARRR